MEAERAREQSVDDVAQKACKQQPGKERRPALQRGDEKHGRREQTTKRDRVWELPHPYGPAIGRGCLRYAPRRSHAVGTGRLPKSLAMAASTIVSM